MGDLKGYLKGNLRLGCRLGGGLQRGLQTGLGRGLAVKLRSVKVQVWFGIEFKFNSFELDSEVGRLVHTPQWYSHSSMLVMLLKVSHTPQC